MSRPRSRSLRRPAAHAGARAGFLPRTVFLWVTAWCLVLNATAAAQPDLTGGNRGGYVLGQDKRLQIVVHVLGEVESPGEYIVSDDTDVLELISKAGGPTEFADLGSVKLKHRATGVSEGRRGKVEKVNLDRFLGHDDESDPPILQPGDVVTVPRNRMASWRTAFSMIRDVSVVVSTYLLYRRVVQNQ